MKLAAVIDRIPNFGGTSYEENVQKFFQTWVEETKKLDLAKVKDGLKGEDVEPQYMAAWLRRMGGFGKDRSWVCGLGCCRWVDFKVQENLLSSPCKALDIAEIAAYLSPSARDSSFHYGSLVFRIAYLTLSHAHLNFGKPPRKCFKAPVEDQTTKCRTLKKQMISIPNLQLSPSPIQYLPPLPGFPPAQPILHHRGPHVWEEHTEEASHRGRMGLHVHTGALWVRLDGFVG